MIEYSTAIIIATGLGLGLLHAFDADHILAVSTMSTQKKSRHQALKYCTHWATGHGLILMVLVLYGTFVSSLLPNFLSLWAELIVGIMLVALGGWSLLSFNQSFIKSFSTSPKRVPILVGLIHGTAGSASILALIPMLNLNSPFIVFSYTLLFSIGVLASMLMVGLLLQKTQSWMISNGNIKWLNRLRISIALITILLGLFWIFY